MESDPALTKAHDQVRKCFIGTGGLKFCDMQENRMIRNVTVQKYNFRELNTKTVAGIVSSLMRGDIRCADFPMVWAVKRSGIKDPDVLLKTKSPGYTLPVFELTDPFVEMILIAGNHRFTAMVAVLELLQRQYVKLGEEEVKLSAEVQKLVGIVEGWKADDQSDPSVVTELRTATEKLKGKEHQLHGVQTDRTHTLAHIHVINHWAGDIYDIGEYRSDLLWTTLRQNCTDLLEQLGTDPKQLPRMLAQNEDLTVLYKQPEEYLLDTITDLVEFDGTPREDLLRATFPRRTPKLRNILVRDSLCSTLFHVARLSDAFKVSQLFSVPWLTDNVLSAVNADVSASVKFNNEYLLSHR